MSWQDEWRSIVLLSSTVLGGPVTQAVISSGRDGDMASCKPIADVMAELASDVRDFLAANAGELGAAADVARQALEDAAKRLQPVLERRHSNPETALRQAATHLLRAQLTIDRAIQTQPARDTSDVERAFVHLQCRLRADEPYRATWVAAFHKNEMSCESLGAAHLLAHGIWAFKAHATDKLGRTDLVLGSTAVLGAKVEETRSTLVLTEWKLHKKGKVTTVIDSALEQAELYSAAPLRGFELTSTRFIVVVSQEAQALPDPVRDVGPPQYRIINIAVDPLAPSKS